MNKQQKEILQKEMNPDFPLQEKIKDWVVKKKQLITVGEISRRLDRSKETVYKLLDDLYDQGVDIKIDSETLEVGEHKHGPFKPQLVRPRYRNEVKIGLISDTHIGSIYQQLSLLHDAYAEMEKEGVDVIVHGGDLSDGPREMHRRREEVFLRDTDDFIDYITKNYPRIKGDKKINTYVLDSGTHDTFFKKHNGVNIVRRVCEERKDLILRRGDEAEFVLPGTEQIMVKLLHPMGAPAYAKSYKQQKQMENLVGDFLESTRTFNALTRTETRLDSSLVDLEKKNSSVLTKLPAILAMGHYHIFNHIEQGSVECFLIPCFQSQTSYLRDKGLYPNIGFLTVTLSLDQHKIISRLDIRPYRWNAYQKKSDF